MEKNWGILDSNDGRISAQVLRERDRKSDPKITSILALHIASTNKQLDIFSSLSAEQMGAIEKFDQIRTIDRNGKLFYLTNFRARLIMHLSSYITKNMPADLIELILDQYGKGNFSVKATWKIDMRKFSAQVFHGRASRKERATLLREIYELATTKQAQIYEEHGQRKAAAQRVVGINGIMGGLNGEWERIPEASDDELEEVDAIEIIFGRLFFIGLNNRYAHITDRLLELWGVKGNGTETELFAVMVNHLLSEYWQVWSSTRAARGRASRDAKAEGHQGEDRKDSMKRASRRARLREIGLADITERLRSPYKSNKRSRMIEDLTKAFGIFEEIGLIEKGWNIDRKLCTVTFHYNDKYGQEDPPQIPP